jgi:hypothetical protein
MARMPVNPPVQVTSAAGWRVRIMELDCDDTDLLHGDIDTPGMGHIQRAWNDVGICRNATPDCNIDVRDPSVAALIARCKP